MTFKNFILGLGIFVIFALVLWQGIAAFYPQPEYDDYCDNAFPRPITSRAEGTVCPSNDALEAQAQQCWEVGGEFRYEYDSAGCPSGGYCDECRLSYDEARDNYSRTVFIIALIIGVITFAVGFSILSIEPVGSALLASGIWSLFYGTVVNWRNFGNLTRFLLLTAVLIILIWVAIRINTKGHLFKKKHKK